MKYSFPAAAGSRHKMTANQFAPGLALCSALGPRLRLSVDGG